MKANVAAAFRLAELALIAELGLILSACGGGSGMGFSPRALIAVSVQPASAQAMAPDGTVPFSATGTFDQNPITQSNLPVQWTSSDSNIASVDVATGVATCLAVGGPVTVTGSATGKQGPVRGSGTLTCQGSPNPVVKFDPASLGVHCLTRGAGGPFCGCIWGANGNSLTVTNVGGSTLSIDSILTGTTGDKGFSQTNTCSASLEPGQSCDVTVAFHAAAKGTFRDDVVIHDDAGGSPQSASLSARVDCIP